ncbi:MAG: tRNA lysidine(34) synthetase TilS [Eubacterium sp.]
MINKIHSTVKKFNMLSVNDRVVVGVSGGADSMLLLNYLLSVKEQYSLDIVVAHVEHGIRGEESVGDARFVEEFCRKNNIEYHQLTIDALNEASEAKIGVEEYSRQKRYEFFNSIECDKIATAHNLSDNAETLIFRLIRGTGLKGACGIPPVRGKIIRPLIEVTSSQIRDYCKENNIEYRVDSTNTVNDYSRNYIRNEIISKFSTINNEYETAINNFISSVNEDEDFIEEVSQKAYEECVKNGMLSIEKLKEYDTAVIKRIIIKFLYCYSITPDRVCIDKVLSVLKRPSRVQLYGSLFAISNGKYLRIADFSERNSDCVFISEILNISEFNPKDVDFYCDYDKIIGDFKIRGRMPHDAISPAGRNCKKSLKKLYNELKIPVELRDDVLVVADDVGVIGVVGYCIDQRVKPDENTKNILSVRLPSED